jgi:hypothetical protein
MLNTDGTLMLSRKMCWYTILKANQDMNASSNWQILDRVSLEYMKD